MAIGLVGGLGQALTTGANQLVDSLKEERDRKRREGIEDEARKRINQTWDQQQQDKEVSDLSDANDVLSVVDPKIVPAWGAEQQFRQFDQPENPQPPADQQAPTAPSVARPTPGAGPVVVPGNAPATRGLVGAPIQIPGAPTSAAQPPPAGDPSAPQAAPGDEPSGPPPGWAPRDPQLAEFHQKYTDLQEKMRPDIDAIRVKSKGDEKKFNSMLAAYKRVHKDEFDDIKKTFDTYTSNTKKAISDKRAFDFVDKVWSMRKEVAEEMYGPGAEFGTDERTGLQGVLLPAPVDAKGKPMGPKLFIGQDVVLAKRMLMKGLISRVEFTKIAMESAKEVSALLKARMDAQAKVQAAGTVHVSVNNKNPDDNPRIQEAKEIGALETRLGALPPGDPRRAPIEAQIRHLSVNENKADATAKNWSDKLDQTGKAQASARTLSTAKAQKSTLTGEFTIDAKTAIQTYLRFFKEDPKQAEAYRDLLTPDLAGEVRKFTDALPPPTATPPPPTTPATGATSASPKGLPDTNTLGTNPRFPKAMWSDTDKGWFQKENGVIKKVE